MRLAEEIKPSFIFLENVPAIRTRGLERVGKELAELGYDCRWGIISAYDMGAPHKRERWFCLSKRRSVDDAACDDDRGAVSNVARSNAKQKRSKERDKDEARQSCDASKMPSVLAGERRRSKPWTEQNRSAETYHTSWWAVEPDMGRVVNGVSDWLDAVDFKPCLAKMRSYAVSTSQNPSKALRALRKDDGASKVHQWRTRGPFNVCEKAVLLPFLRRLERLYSQEYDAQAGSEVSQGIVRGVRDRQGAASTPYRPKPIQQRGGKYSDSLQELSRFLALYCAENWQKNRGAHAIHRVERLRGLGNAVVPVQAREAFRRLAGINIS